MSTLDGVDVWPITIAARRSLVETFEQLDDEQWNVTSLCAGWTNREMLAHLILAARPPRRRYVRAIVGARGNFDRANRRLAIDDARQPLDHLLTEYRSVLDHRFSPPGWPPEAPLSDILLHSLDVRIPLGIDSNEPPEHFAPVLKLLLGPFGKGLAPKGRPAVRWEATDHPWSHGDEAAVRGSMADVALAMSGRDARLDALTGDGVGQVRAWIG